MIKYPTYLTNYGPTPLSALYVCPKCEQAEWSFEASGSSMPYCHCTGSKATRMRRATTEETEEGKKAIKTVLGKK